MTEKEIKKEEIMPPAPAAPAPAPEGPSIAELAEQVAELKQLIAELAAKLNPPAEETPNVEASAEPEKPPAPDVKELVGEEVKKAMAERFGQAQTPRVESADVEEVKKNSKTLVDEAMETISMPKVSAPRLR